MGRSKILCDIQVTQNKLLVQTSLVETSIQPLSVIKQEYNLVPRALSRYEEIVPWERGCREWGAGLEGRGAMLHEYRIILYNKLKAIFSPSKTKGSLQVLPTPSPIVLVCMTSYSKRTLLDKIMRECRIDDRIHHRSKGINHGGQTGKIWSPPSSG